MERTRIGVIGSGSWATALIKIIQPKISYLNWYVRSEDNIKYIKEHKTNNKYLPFVHLDVSRIRFSTNINDVIEKSDVIIFAIPSAFLKDSLKGVNNDLSNKFIVSAIKGIIPEENLLISEFFNKHYNVPMINFAVISGPSHAEEIAAERLSYLTLATRRVSRIAKVANKLESEYVRIIVSKDIYGIEYASVLKNIIAISAGVCHGLGYGDNFQAVLISNAIREIKRFLDKLGKKNKRQINSSAYLGDLLVTAYSNYSRNREFGTMIGKGYSVRSAKTEMNMIAEGYYASKCIHEINQKVKAKMPIAEAVYKILYENEKPSTIINLLTKELH